MAIEITQVKHPPPRPFTVEPIGNASRLTLRLTAATPESKETLDLTLTGKDAKAVWTFLHPADENPF